MTPPSDSFQLPPQMSTGAQSVDNLYNIVFWFSIVFTVGITGAMLYFVAKYRRRSKARNELQVPDLTKLEIFWTVTPVLFIVWLFHIAFDTYITNATAAEGALEIRVRGKKWSWSFEYPTGQSEPAELWLPVNKPVKLILSSDDVIHSFYIPAFRQKRDAVPGMYSHIAFTPNVIGETQVYCAEFCGTSHSSMLAKIHVVTEAEYQKHVDELDKAPEGKTPAEWGKDLFVKNGCPTCHSVDGSKSNGPSLKGVYGTPQACVGMGPQMADENYLRESILRPQAKIVDGYSTLQMPLFKFKDPQVDAIIAYIKTLK